MSATQTRISVTQRDDAMIVRCLDEKLDDEQVIEKWAFEIHALIDEVGSRMLIVDFQNVFIATSLVLGGLLSLKFKTRDRKIPFGLCGLNEYIMETFKMTCLDKAFVIGDNEESVVEQLKQA